MKGKPAAPYLGIGEVLVELRDEFPDVTVSKIRFLESAGLIAPARSPSGYRRFAPDDIDRLRVILLAQRDQYLPLRVIKERLLPPGGPAGAQAGETAPGPPPRRQTDEMVSRRELLESAGIDDDQLAELEAHGLVRRVGRLYGQDALDVAATAAALAGFGVQPRHLRAACTAADRDMTLIEQVVAPVLRQRSASGRGDAARSARQIAALLQRLHQALVAAKLAEAGLAGEELPRQAGRPGGIAAPAIADGARERTHGASA